VTLDGYVITAPTTNAVITAGSAQIIPFSFNNILYSLFNRHTNDNNFWYLVNHTNP
jgi:hypothetical protein